MIKKNVVFVTLLVATLIAVPAIVVCAIQAEQNTEKQVDAIIEEIGGNKNIDKKLAAKLESIADEFVADVDFNSLFAEAFININFEKAFAALDSVGLKPEWVNRPYCLSGLSGKKIWVAVDIERAARVEPYGLTAELILHQTKKQLQDYGIKVISQKELQAIPDYQRLVLMLYINISTQLIEGIDVVPINTYVGFLETVQLARSPEKFCIATTWEKNVIQMGMREALPHVTTTVWDIVQVFINDYLTANPKKADEKPSRLKDKTTWVKCRNYACGTEYEMYLKAYFEFIEENINPRMMAAPPMTCKKCREPSVYRAVKCGQCGMVFEMGSIPRDFADRCPKCGYSQIEKNRKHKATRQ